LALDNVDGVKAVVLKPSFRLSQIKVGRGHKVVQTKHHLALEMPSIISIAEFDKAFTFTPEPNIFL
jgi:hypothetical protein